MRFGRKCKLSSRYVGPFEILCAIGEVAYELALLTNFSTVYPVFHVFMLRKYIPDISRVLRWDSV